MYFLKYFNIFWSLLILYKPLGPSFMPLNTERNYISTSTSTIFTFFAVVMSTKYNKTEMFISQIFKFKSLSFKSQFS